MNPKEIGEFFASLCKENYQITINELLSGKRLNDSDYKEMAEQNIKKVLTANASSVFT